MEQQYERSIMLGDRPTLDVCRYLKLCLDELVILWEQVDELRV